MGARHRGILSTQPSGPTMTIDLPPALLRRAPPPRCVRYARVGIAGEFPLPRMTIEESWGDPVEQDGRLVYRRVSRVVSDTPRTIEDALIGYGPDGLTDLGTYKDDVLSLWDPKGDAEAGEDSRREDASHADGRDLQRPVQKRTCRAPSQEELERCIEGEEDAPGDGDGDA